ncbi:potassium-transporting ATPase subunit C [Streptomyces decoyicus]|uniref:potassium-transporting ATPase subunit C n=1 Tax=Streptomyces decoyicus TaxID=249567 RepID=UPI002E19C10C|nr:potassium-transporting ATPase subunit C [Streptomyces decoyicus]WSV51576.1 potassium-transporting ATPase subunit C [Streptomyces decoyicus]
MRGQQACGRPQPPPGERHLLPDRGPAQLAIAVQACGRSLPACSARNSPCRRGPGPATSHPAGVEKLVTEHLQGRVLGFLGQENVNVVELNHVLAELM